ncbi:hypothetical protein [Nocardiopsis synnemataformans]|uniref:hypothetical protein n=1 Tax=Nocardiopsis synnemataformans TaxID=61305 RepID=UPI003EBEDE99
MIYVVDELPCGQPLTAHVQRDPLRITILAAALAPVRVALHECGRLLKPSEQNALRGSLGLPSWPTPLATVYPELLSERPVISLFQELLDIAA